MMAEVMVVMRVMRVKMRCSEKRRDDQGEDAKRSEVVVDQYRYIHTARIRRRDRNHLDDDRG
jgi:hypothetical protein